MVGEIVPGRYLERKGGVSDSCIASQYFWHAESKSIRSSYSARCCLNRESIKPHSSNQEECLEASEKKKKKTHLPERQKGLSGGGSAIGIAEQLGQVAVKRERGAAGVEMVGLQEQSDRTTSPCDSAILSLFAYHRLNLFRQ